MCTSPTARNNYIAKKNTNTMRNDWINKPLNKFSAHICSDGTKSESLFNSEENCIRAMNLIPIICNLHSCRILCLEVMLTHFHLIVQGNPDDCERARCQIKRLLVNYYVSSDQKELLGNGIDISLYPIYSSDKLKEKIIYVYRNAVAAGSKLLPNHYPWGPGNAYFSNHTEEAAKGIPVSSLPKRRIIELFHSHGEIPGDWRIDEKGMLIPHSYIDYQYVETLFGSPIAFLAFLHQRKETEAQIDSECSISLIQKSEESELRKEANDYAKNLFQRKNTSKASFNERMTIAKRLWADRRTYSISVLSRVTYIDKSVLQAAFGKDMVAGA